MHVFIQLTQYIFSDIPIMLKHDNQKPILNQLLCINYNSIVHIIVDKQVA